MRGTDSSSNRRLPVVILSIVIVVFVAFFALCNISSVASSLEKVPIIGELVHVLRIGGGGKTTDGTHAAVSATTSSIRINFTQDSNPTSNAPNFNVLKFSAPHRLLFTLNGVRSFDFDATREDFEKLPFVSDVYKIIYLDDSAYSFVVELTQDVDYKVSEYRHPGYIELSFLAPNKVEPSGVYFVRSPSMPMDEGLAAVCDALGSDHASMVKTQDGEFCVASPVFSSKADAARELVFWQAIVNSKFKPYIESAMTNKKPK
ncbi:MAG: hypothetical protein RSA70_03305 [Clostridia bacterium]